MNNEARNMKAKRLIHAFSFAPAAILLAAAALFLSVTMVLAFGENTANDADDLDLREANVAAVDVEKSGTGAYRFHVTLFHDDAGEDGYANWWQVETLSGKRLGRRKLLHAHGTRKFTRSETIRIPGDVQWVLVRGHDQTHSYGGRAVVLNPESGESEPVRQGPEPQTSPSHTQSTYHQSRTPVTLSA
ncbi:MAG: hypothetical protein V5B78_09810 [Desulfohalobiaceae bacterium]